MSEKILLIDGHSILNRAFYGLPDLTNQRETYGSSVRVSEYYVSYTGRRKAGLSDSGI